MSITRCALAAAAAAALAVPATGGAAGATRLTAVVGPGETIVLKTAGGARVTTLKRGTYTIVVQDRSSEHNFRLRGPGINRASAVGFTGTATWRVTLRPGSYRYVCDPHADDMRGSFRVT